jgi:hypothetical protein
MATRDNKNCVSLPGRANIIPKIPAGFTYYALSACHLENTVVDAWHLFASGAIYSGNATNPSVNNVRDGRTMQNQRMAGGWVKGPLFTHFDNLTYLASAWEFGRMGRSKGCAQASAINSCAGWNSYGVGGLYEGISQNYKYIVFSSPHVAYNSATTNMQMIQGSQAFSTYNNTNYGWLDDRTSTAYNSTWTTISPSNFYNSGTYSFWGATQDLQSFFMYPMIWRP